MKWTYDRMADAGYLDFKKSCDTYVASSKTVLPGVVCDFDRSKKLLGVEFI